ncbi:MAG: metal ABC transporter ATP-binding protein [Proteobacteria bacterium]|nr:metal ABC transporter ATP-binding protein [Pseudomonadota bacterium]
MTETAIEFDDVTVSYDRHPAVHHLSVRINKGSMVALVGPNGAGKTTLLKAAMGLLTVDTGRIVVPGIGDRAIAYLPQQAEIDRRFPITVLDTVLLGHWQKIGAFGRVAPSAIGTAQAALTAVGLSQFDDRPIGTLSAGQFQRVLFARMLVADARLILLDEPFNAIDARTTLDLIGVIRRWHAEERTIVCVLHDLDIVRAEFPETLLIARSPVAWGATESTLTPANLNRARSMAESWQDAAGVCEARAG